MKRKSTKLPFTRAHAVKAVKLLRKNIAPWQEYSVVVADPKTGVAILRKIH
jgi:hypothetical protein